MTRFNRSSFLRALNTRTALETPSGAAECVGATHNASHGSTERTGFGKRLDKLGRRSASGPSAHRPGGSGIIAGLLIMIATTAMSRAQSHFEYVYGDSIDYGRAAVRVTECSPAGFIAVGSTRAVDVVDDEPVIHDDVYVVRTDASGARVWEYRYDIRGTHVNDTGYSIRQVPGSEKFIITGGSQLGEGGSDMFLLEIDCNGAVNWSKVYRVGDWSTGFDVIVAQQGGTGGTSAGDYVVCGYMEKKPEYGGVNGFVLRANTTGTLIWSSTLKVGAVANPGPATSNEWFNALTECVLGGSQSNVGDIVAVGLATNPLVGPGQQGYVVRMNGTNGRISGTNRGVAYYGGQLLDDFQGVRELTVRGEAGNLIIVGTTHSNAVRAGHPKIYLVKTGPDPCSTIAQAVIGDLDSTILDFGMDVEEVIDADGFYDDEIDDGDLVLTGACQHASFSAEEMFLLPVFVSNLEVVAMKGTKFGDLNSGQGQSYWTGSKQEWGETVHVLDDGFILCGWSKGNLEHDLYEDSLDLYLVRTDVNGATECDDPYAPERTLVEWPDSCRAPDLFDSTTVVDADPGREEMSTAHNVCYDAGVPPMEMWVRPAQCTLCKPAPRGRDRGRDEIGTRMSRLVPAPNPVSRGEEIYINGALLEGPQVRVDVVDGAGRIVSEQMLRVDPGYDRLPLATGGLSPGAYTVVIHDGTRRMTTRLIIAP